MVIGDVVETTITVMGEGLQAKAHDEDVKISLSAIRLAFYKPSVGGNASNKNKKALSLFIETEEYQACESLIIAIRVTVYMH